MTYPFRSRSVCEFFESIGVDPYTVLEDGVNDAGYRAVQFNEDGSRRRDSLGVVAKFTPWPTDERAVSYYTEFRMARDQDERRVYSVEGVICENCGSVDLEKLP